MRVFVAMLALSPIFAGAQDLGTYQILGGDLAGGGANLTGTFAGNGFLGTLYGYPLPMYVPAMNSFRGGDLDFSMELSPPAGRDDGLYMSMISGPIDLAAEGLSPVHYSGPYSPYIQESGELATPLIDVTGPGAFSVPFTMSADVGYGAPGTTVPAGYVDFVGAGTVTFDVLPQQCNNGACGPMVISHVDYSFAQAPELDPASFSGALMLLGGGLLVLLGRRPSVR
jgi:hypothetical protein